MANIYHTEQLGGLRLTIGQEWDGAGLYWELEAVDCWPLPPYKRRSMGRFYPDQGGEVIHGATVEDVVQTARKSALQAAGYSE